ncbi:DUF1761 domain-containing protein [Agromyces intestinalis]|uniref:DUF1761 domain-containing protein n=1 Tax=Agromyces intestinalis TaxID=2592652 RepID=A0A5C1YJD4_9MICO|nr:DUF1761 domain-containing protein [Agromyces intestinalis]QEO15370.1 DUF1761 domain-containing protein [Agromyces intestinalis]
MLDVNYWAVILATLSTLVIGSIWYTPKVFGRRWAELAKVDLDNPGNAFGAVITTVVVSFITAWVLAITTQTAWVAWGGGYLGLALGVGTMLWAGFTAARFITHDAFEGRPPALTLMNIAHELVTVVVMALIIGVWPPAGTV